MSIFCLIAPDTDVFLKRLGGLENADTWLLHNVDIEQPAGYEQVLRWVNETRPICAIFDFTHLNYNGPIPQHVRMSKELAKLRIPVLFFHDHQHNTGDENMLCEVMSDLQEMAHVQERGQDLIDFIKGHVEAYHDPSPSIEDLGLQE